MANGIGATVEPMDTVEESPEAEVEKINGRAIVQITNKERQLKALEARRRGYTWDRVATEAGYKSGKSAQRAVSRLLQRNELEGVEDLRNMQIDRCNQYLVALTEGVEAGNTKAIDTALRVMDKIDKYAGIEDRSQRPTEHRHVISVESTEREYIQNLQAAAPTELDPSHPYAQVGESEDDITDAEVID